MHGTATDHPVQAALCVFAGMGVIGLMDNLIPLIAAEAGLWQLHATRTGLALPLMGLVAWVTGWRLWPRRFWPVAGRSLVLGASMMIYFGCLAFMPIGVVVAGLFTAPIFVLILSALVWRKPVGSRRWAAALGGFAGVLVVIRAGGGADGGFEPVMALPVLAGALYAVAAIGTRAWCEGESALTMTAGVFVALGLLGLGGLFAVAGADPAASGFVLRPAAVPTGAFLGWTAVHAVGAGVGVALLVRGYQLGEASYVAIYEYSLMIFATAWAWVLWRDLPGLGGAVGMAMIVASGAVISLRSARRDRADILEQRG